MFKKLKEAFVFPMGDPNWLNKMGYWWLFYLLYITSPIVFGHYIELVKQSMTDPDEETLPVFDDLWGMWKSGLGKMLAAGLPLTGLAMINMACMMVVGGFSGNSGPNGLFFVFFTIHFILCFGMMIFWPAFLLQLLDKNDWTSVFRLGEVFKIATANVGAYLMVALVYPFLMWLCMVATAMTIVGLILFLPGIPLAMMAHARLIGLYYNENIRQS